MLTQHEAEAVSMDISYQRGYVAASGSSIDAIAHTSIQKLNAQNIHFNHPLVPFHITLITKAELRSLSGFELGGFTRTLHNARGPVTALGPGGHTKSTSKVLFVVVIWNAAQQARKKLGLPTKQLHITLSRDDDHSIDKGIDSLLHLAMPYATDHLDEIVISLMLEQKNMLARDFAVDLCLRLPDSSRGFVRTGDIAMILEQYKLAMLCFGRALSLEPNIGGKVEQYCLEKLVMCAKYTEWGAIFAHDEQSQIPQNLYADLTMPWTIKTRQLISNHAWSDGSCPVLSIDSRTRVCVPLASLDMYELPRYFRWVVPFRFALMSTPRREEDINILSSPHLCIRHVITLTEETPLPSSWFSNNPHQISHTHLPIPNYQSPNIQQMDYILRLFSESTDPILIHCGGGKGRAGTVAACYLAAYGFRPPELVANPTQPMMTSNEAINAIREIRPGSIETEQQEDFVRSWCSAVWKRQAVLPTLPPEPSPTVINPPLDIKGQLPSKYDLIVLVGLPGSGKSWFSSAILARSPMTSWRVVSQDDAGSRSTCEADIGRRGSGKAILDRCNPTVSDRRQWLSLAATWATHPICIVFEYSSELCISRAQQRPNHPTLPIGGRVVTAVKSIEKMMEQPTLEEGYVAIITIRTFSEASELVQRIAPTGLLKFPRTPHLLDLGAVTDDDLVSTEPLMPDTSLPERSSIRGNTVVITEKIDGANLGFSLSYNKEIVVQNRSHHVNTSSHQQFKKLGLWIETHREALHTILNRDPSFTERYILYGEWMAATHSLAYTNLPDHFIAFDLYDRISATFCPRKKLDGLLSDALSQSGQRIHSVPVLWEGLTIPDDATLKGMVYTTPSRFGDTGTLIVEGVYIKIENEEKVLRRGKVVRGDFIAGNEHWTKGQIKWNVVTQNDDESNEAST